jgi:muramoyltetrapeptide carboxypeptidase
MQSNRRRFIRNVSILAVPASKMTSSVVPSHANPQRQVIRPDRLAAGDTVALINPAGATFHTVDLDIARDSLTALGLKVKLGDHVLGRRGYFSGTDQERARDFNAQFAEPSVKGVFSVRGGWGSGRILPLIDFEQIIKNPKVLMGYSDITVLLNAVHARTGLITFHGPVGTSSWNPFTVGYLKQILFEGQAATMANPRESGENLAQVEDRVQTITPGIARGRLLGGNLTVLSAILGSGYLPDWEGALLFLEDTDEAIYRVDRMLTQLKLNGILDRLAGFIFGKCTRCGPGEGYGSLTLEEVLKDHIAPLRIPAWFGAMIGHIPRVFVLPVGAEAETDATAGTIRLLAPAVG